LASYTFAFFRTDFAKEIGDMFTRDSLIGFELVESSPEFELKLCDDFFAVKFSGQLLDIRR
jgi:hypothetical protein